MLPSWILEREARITASKIRNTEAKLERLRKRIPFLLRDVKTKARELKLSAIFSERLKNKIRLKEKQFPTSNIDLLMAKRRGVRSVRDVLEKQEQVKKSYNQYRKSVQQYNSNLSRLKSLIDYYNSVSFKARMRYRQEQKDFLNFVASRTKPEEFYNILSREGYINPKKYTKEMFFKDIGYNPNKINPTNLTSRKITPDYWTPKPKVFNINRDIRTIQKGNSTTYIYTLPVSNMKNYNLTLTQKETVKKINVPSGSFNESEFQQFKKNFEKLPKWKQAIYFAPTPILSEEVAGRWLKEEVLRATPGLGTFLTYQALKNPKKTRERVRSIFERGVYELAKADVELKEAEKKGGLTYTKTSFQKLVWERPLARLGLEWGIAKLGGKALGIARYGAGKVIISSGGKVINAGRFLQGAMDVSLSLGAISEMVNTGKRMSRLQKQGREGKAIMEGLYFASGILGGLKGIEEGMKTGSRLFKPNEFIKISSSGIKKVSGSPFKIYAFENVGKITKPSGSYFLTKGRLRMGYLIEGGKLISKESYPFEVKTIITNQKSGVLDKLFIDLRKNKVYDYRKDPLRWFRESFITEAKAFNKKGKVISESGSIGQTFGFIGKKGKVISSDIFLTEKGRGFGITTSKENKYIGVSFVEDLTKNVIFGNKKRGMGAILKSDKASIEMYKRIGLGAMRSKKARGFDIAIKYTTSEGDLISGEFGRFRKDLEKLGRETFTFEVGGSKYYYGKGKGNNRNILKDLSEFYKKKPIERVNKALKDGSNLITEKESLIISKSIEKVLPKLEIKPRLNKNVVVPIALMKTKTKSKKVQKEKTIEKVVPLFEFGITKKRKTTTTRKRFKQEMIYRESTLFGLVPRQIITPIMTPSQKQKPSLKNTPLFTPQLIPVPPIIKAPKLPKPPIKVPSGKITPLFGAGFPFGFGGFGLSKKGRGKGKPKYAPSVVALNLRIFSKKPQKARRKNPFEIRPIVLMGKKRGKKTLKNRGFLAIFG